MQFINEHDSLIVNVPPDEIIEYIPPPFEPLHPFIVTSLNSINPPSIVV
jgi:hypothetical protein